MAKIRALLYREWRLMSKHILIGSFSVTAMLLMALLFYLSAQYGNLKEELKNDLDTMQFLGTFGYYYVFYLTVYIIVALVLPSKTYRSDVAANWCRFEIALPVTPHDHALAHTLGVTLRMLGGWLFILIVTLILNLIADKSLSLNLVTDVGIMTAIILLIDNVSDYFYSAVKDTIGFKKANVKITAFLVTCGLVVGFLVFHMINVPASEPEELNIEAIASSPVIKQIAEYRSAVQPFVLPAIILLLILTYLFTKRGCQKQRLT